MPTINFLTAKRKDKAKRNKGLLAVRIAAVSYMVVIGLLSVSAFYFSNRVSLDSAKTNEDSFLKTLAPLRSHEAKLLIIKNRIADISEILKRREDVAGKERAKKANYEKIITSFNEKIPQGISLNTLNVDESKVILNLSSDSLSLMEDLINGLTSLGQDGIISSLLLDSLSLSQDKSTYSILLTATL